jgi:condensation domain-containing protein
MADRITVAFEGQGRGTDGLAWGQQVIWHAIQKQGSTLNLDAVRPLAGGETVAGAAAGLRFLMGRHDSLRTRLRLVPGEPPRQVVEPRGELTVEVIEAGGDDPADTARQVALRWRGTDFDHTVDWPVRAAVITKRGAASHVAEVVSHLAADAFGLAALHDDLASFDPRTGRATAPVTAMQPLEQVRWQRGPAGQLQTQAAMRYWERQLRMVPPAMFGQCPPAGRPRSVHARFVSPAGHLASRQVAARERLGTSPVLFAAFAVALAAVTGSNPVLAQVVVHNRFRPRLAGSVSPVNQACLCVIDVAGIAFGEAVKRAWHSAMGAYKHAYYDPAALEGPVGRVVSERAGGIDLSCFFNDLRGRGRDAAGGAAADGPAPATLWELAGQASLTWEPPRDEDYCDRVFLYALDVPGTLALRLRADERYLDAAAVTAVLRGIEEILIRAALDPAVATGIASAAA